MYKCSTTLLFTGKYNDNISRAIMNTLLGYCCCCYRRYYCYYYDCTATDYQWYYYCYTIWSRRNEPLSSQ